MHDDDRVEIARLGATEDGPKALPGEAVREVNDERFSVQEAREACEGLAEALARGGHKPVGLARPARTVVESLANLVGQPVAGDDGDLVDAGAAQPVERMPEERSVGDRKKRRRGRVPVSDPEGRAAFIRGRGRVAGEDHRFGGLHGVTTSLRWRIRQEPARQGTNFVSGRAATASEGQYAPRPRVTTEKVRMSSLMSPHRDQFVT
jgi:hypothetical protein